MTRNLSLDFLKLFMALMVVGLHTGFAGGDGVANYLAVNGLFRIAVPVFLVINGFYFYPVLKAEKQFEWLKRIGILYLVWMGVYGYFWMPMHDLSGASWLGLFSRFVIGYTHLWYISGLIGAALVVILLRKLNLYQAALVIAVAFLIGVAIQYTGIYHLSRNPWIDDALNYIPTHRNFLFFSLPFFYIGYLIREYKFEQSRFSDYAWVWLLIGLTLLEIEAYVNYFGQAEHRGLDNYVSLIIACPAIFLFFQKKYIEGESKSIALYSSALYFVHVFVISVLVKLWHLSGGKLTLMTIVISLVASAIVVKINKRIPYLL